jgi:hypothetical protein
MSDAPQIVKDLQERTLDVHAQSIHYTLIVLQIVKCSEERIRDVHVQKIHSIGIVLLSVI